MRNRNPNNWRGEVKTCDRSLGYHTRSSHYFGTDLVYWIKSLLKFAFINNRIILPQSYFTLVVFGYPVYARWLSCPQRLAVIFLSNPLTVSYLLINRIVSIKLNIYIIKVNIKLTLEKPNVLYRIDNTETQATVGLKGLPPLSRKNLKIPKG